jgi:CBS domain-containing protein
MTQNPACCTPNTTLQEVARLMREHDCGLIPVVGSLGDMKPVGTITDRDITIRTLADNRNPMDMKASDVMTTDIATVTPETSLEECFDVMEDKEIRRVRVVDERGRCCGIVAQADIVQSGVNPIRANRVIREISESSPSSHQANSRGEQNYKSYLSKQSFINGSSLFPLLIGLGSGVALTYLFNSRQKSSERDYSGVINESNAFDYQDATNEANFGKYVDAEEEIEKRQYNLQERLESARENILPFDKKTESLNKEDEANTNEEKSRTAIQGNS